MTARWVSSRLTGIARVKEAQEEQEQQAAEVENEESDQVEGTSPSQSLDAYALEHSSIQDTARSAWNCPTVILEVTFNNMTGELEHYHYDVFEIMDDPLNVMGGHQSWCSALTNAASSTGSRSPWKPMWTT